MVATRDIDAEVFVVDNNSVDNSVKMVREKFPSVILIENHENTGFSRANNQAMRQSKGEYILLLNPDTIVENDTFTKIIGFMDSHPDAGGLGVKMIDGKGRYLPESKRGLPTPFVAFCKISGLSKVFPHSRIFNRYHLGYLNTDQVAEVEILSGAFMFMRREALDKSGLLDESFFMYGEDIDLSYRLILAGYKNYYFPVTRIIHYKGESTKKGSLNYVKMFYNAMIVFAEKHFSGKNAKLFSILINCAIYFRAFIAVLNRMFSRLSVLIFDLVLLMAGMIAIKNYWEDRVVFPWGGHYPSELIQIAIPLYILLWTFSVYMAGGYDKPFKLYKIFTGIFSGTIIILVMYSLLPEALRFSRAIILLGALWGLAAMTGLRLLYNLVRYKKASTTEGVSKRYVVIGSRDEADRVADLLRKSFLKSSFIGYVSPGESVTTDEVYIGNINQIREIIQVYGIDEVIFCARDIPARKIINLMAELQNNQIDYKIAPPESLFIIGSKSISTPEDIYIFDLNSITTPNNKRNKRLADIILALIFLAGLPIALLVMRNPLGFIGNLFRVLFGVRSWVGYSGAHDDLALPKIKTGILDPSDAFTKITLKKETIRNLNLLYARDYKVTSDLRIIYSAFRNLGR